MNRNFRCEFDLKKMNYIIDLQNLKHKCRVCLTPSNQMIALTCKLNEENEASPEIYNALENIFSTKVLYVFILDYNLNHMNSPYICRDSVK